jgi:hypothetical protein
MTIRVSFTDPLGQKTTTEIERKSVPFDLGPTLRVIVIDRKGFPTDSCGLDLGPPSFGLLGRRAILPVGYTTGGVPLIDGVKVTIEANGYSLSAEKIG